MIPSLPPRAKIRPKVGKLILKHIFIQFLLGPEETGNNGHFLLAETTSRLD